MKKTFFALIILLFSISQTKAQSWLAQITGINVDLNRQTVSVKPPDINAIPKMIQNLPKDVSQALLNPLAPILASSIRFSRGQALNRGTQHIPGEIKQKLTPYFPANILNNTTWTTANGISIDGALKNWFNLEGAVTLDDVVAFSDAQLANDVALWAHELTHVLQYSQMGVETFAFQYSYDWNSLESQARDNSSRIMSSINNSQQGISVGGSWLYKISNELGPLAWSDMNTAAKLAIPPTECIWVNNQNNTTGNKCPCSIMVTGVVMKRIADGFVMTMPCNEPTCLIPAGKSGPLISPYGFIITGVTAAYEYK